MRSLKQRFREKNRDLFYRNDHLTVLVHVMFGHSMMRCSAGIRIRGKKTFVATFSGAMFCISGLLNVVCGTIYYYFILPQDDRCVLE